MNRNAFHALVFHDLHLFFSSRRFGAVLFAGALIQSLWLLFLSLFSPFLMTDAAASLSTVPLFLLVAIPSFSLMTWRDERREGSLCLVFSALLSSRAMALARFTALFLCALVLCVLPFFAVGILSFILPVPILSFIPLLIALIWLAGMISLFTSLFALLFSKGPFALLFPLCAAVLALLLERVLPPLAAYLPFRHWHDFMDGVVPLQGFSVFVLLFVPIMFFEGRLVESLRRGGQYSC